MHNDIADELASNGWLSRRIAQDAATVPSGPLSGLTYVAKDLFDVAGMPTIAGSPSNANASPAQTNAAAITLLNQAGARLVGLSNMDALAYGFVTDNPLYGPALNPHDRARSCGGSSGGSAGAVAAGLVDFALGTDTAGSVRVPAAFTGLFGFKPTSGLFSTEGVAPLAPSLDRVGLFARDPKTLYRAACVLSENAVARSGTSAAPKLARLTGYFSAGLERDIADAVDTACRMLCAETAVNVEGTAKARAAGYIIGAHEAAATHAEAMRTRLASFDPQTRARLVAASAIPSVWVATARAFQEMFTHRLDHAFEHNDFLIAPTVRCAAPLLSELRQPTTSAAGYLRATLGLYTQPISLTGFPVLSVPIRVPGSPLPTALQVIAKPGGDAALMDFAQTLSLDSKGLLA